MGNKPVDVKNVKKFIKGTSLIGQEGGSITMMESDQNGKILRSRPFYYDEGRDFESLNPWKIEAHGKEMNAPRRSVYSYFGQSYKKRVYSNNRVRYPLKRVDFDPNGERNPQNRGKSGYVRISWDEAAQIIADELVRIRDTYGPEAVLSEADMHGEGKHIAPCHGCMNRLLSLMGGYTIQMRNQDSWEGWCWGAKNVWGCEAVGEMGPNANLYPDICKNSEQLLFWGCDPEVTPSAINGMMASRLCYFMSSIGIKSIYISPDFNYGACAHGDKWITVLPSTDAALQLSIAYVWLTEGTYEKEYIETHAVGYEEFFDYVLGKVDGEPKTPEWAYEKCHTKPWTIRALARVWVKRVTSIIHSNGGGLIRGPFSTEPGRLEPILLGMQGLGMPGRHQAKMIEWNLFTEVYPMPYQSKVIVRLPIFAESVRPANSLNNGGRFALNASKEGKLPALTELLKPMENPPKQAVPKCMVHDAILNGHAEWYGLYSFCGPAEEQWMKFEYPAPGCSKIHMIWTDSPGMVTNWNDSYRYVEAVQSPEIEFMVAQHPWLEDDCLLADIILPIVTHVEMDDLIEDVSSGTFQSLFRERPATPPVGESVTDFEAVARVAKKLGPEYYSAYTKDKTTEEVIELFYHSTDVDEHMDYEEFDKQEIFVAPCDPDIQSVPAGLYNFWKDPENNPLTTPTGKLEFTSTKLTEVFPNDKERPPYPQWIERGEFHDERITSERAKEYPLLCMSNHGRWRMHAQCDDITWFREIETCKIRAKDGYQYEPCWINPEEAEKRGIKHGDIVKVYNERGVVLCGAYVTERLMPGVCYVDHGARFDPIDPLWLDRGGAINLITPHGNISKNATGMVVTGFLTEVAKVTDEEMEGWKKQYPESFARKIDNACGVCLDGWMKG